MKKSVNNLQYALLIAGALFFTACGNSNTKTGGHEHAEGAEHVYSCPMHPEVKGKESDKCPKCGMALEHNDGVTNTNTYFMAFAANPSTVQAGKEALLSFTPKIKDKETEAVPLEVVHDKKLHLIVVSKDLSYFDHIHPEYTTNGSYDINVISTGKEYAKGRFHSETKFETGGEYVLFADYAPTGASHQLERIELNVAGKPYSPKKFTKEQTTASIDGYTISLEVEGGKWLSEQASHISAIVKQGATEIPANQFENYLGAKAHMVVISADSKDYLHVHPDIENGRLDLHTTFKAPGMYRGWLQFQTGGKVHTADFVFLVTQGVAPAATEHEGHSH